MFVVDYQLEGGTERTMVHWEALSWEVKRRTKYDQDARNKDVVELSQVSLIYL